MAEATGNFSAYRQLTPLKGSVVDDMNNQEQLGFQRRAEKRAIEDQAQRKQEAKDRKRAEVLSKVNAQKLYDTGSATWNERLHEGLREAYNKWDDIIPVLTNPENYSDKEVIKANLIADNLNSYVDQVSAMDKTTREFVESYRKDVAAGKKWPNPDFEQKFKEGFNNKAIGVNELGEAVVYFIDEDGDGLDDNTGKPGKIGDFMTYSEVLDGTGLTKYNFEDRFNYESVLNDLSKQIKSVENKRPIGNEYVTTIGLDENALEERVNATLFNQDGTPSAMLNSFSKEFNVDVNDPKKTQAFKESIKEALRLRSKGGEKREFITDPIEFQKLQDARAKEQKNKPLRTPIKITENLKDEFAQKNISANAVLPNAIGVTKGGNGIPFKNIGGEKTGVNSGFVTGFALDRNTGQVVVYGKALKSKGKKFKINNNVFSFQELENEANSGNEEAKLALNEYREGDNYGDFVRSMSEKGAAPFVLEAGYSSVEELINELKAMNQNESSTTKPKISEKNKKLGSKYN